MRMFYTRLRARMLVAGLWPQGWIVRGACYSLGLAVGLFVLQMVLNLFAPSWAGSIGGWVKFLVFDAALLFSIVAFRWLKRKLLWRLRNRLIVTYVFIGVIPAFLLVAMAAITIYLFAGQFASFVVTSEINSQLRSLQAVNAAVSNELAARIEKGRLQLPSRWQDCASATGPGGDAGSVRGTGHGLCCSAPEAQIRRRWPFLISSTKTAASMRRLFAKASHLRK